ncbi:MAG: HD-GYP domain-containing protein [Nitrospinota bacterium]
MGLWGGKRENPLGVSFPAVLAALSRAFDLAEGRAPGHSLRVAYICLRLAALRRRSAAATLDLFYAALLHDAGLSSLNAELIRAPGRFPQDEFLILARHVGSPWGELAEYLTEDGEGHLSRALRAHPDQGRALADAMGMPRAVGRMVAAHHELPDATGYPRGLRGRRIPWGARVLALADKVEAAWSYFFRQDLDAVHEFLRAQRHLFDGTLYDAFRGELARESDSWDQLDRPDLAQVVLRLLPRGWDTPTGEELERACAALASLADERSRYPLPHSLGVAALAERMGARSGLRGGRLYRLKLAGLLHDLGVLGVRGAVLEKRGPLEPEERAEVRTHAYLTQMALAEVPGFAAPARWAGGHHERPDGKGYWRGLRDGELEVEMRLLALAESYLSLTSDRPHRDALSREEALSLMMEEERGKFDESLFGALLVETAKGVGLGVWSSG